MIHVLGDLNVDLILSGMTVPPAFGKEIIGTERCMAPGGSSANVAIILAATGVPVPGAKAGSRQSISKVR